MRFLTGRALTSPPAARAAPPARARRPRRLSRRMLLTTLGGTLLCIAAGAAMWSVRSGFAASAADALSERAAVTGGTIGLTVANVEVEGRSRANREAILHALGVRRGTPILAVNPMEAKARLEAITWVRSADVERRLPDTIHVHLVERQPLAYWQRRGKLVLIDREGVVVPTDRLDVFAGLIVLVGEDAPSQGAALLDMLTTEPALAKRVAGAVRVGGRRWNLHMDNGIDVELPEEDPAAAWHHLAELDLKDRLLSRNIETVDLRLPDRLVVRVVPEASKPASSKKGRQPGKAT
jgi:cell division protein FtsQ